MAKIAVVEDQAEIRDLLTEILSKRYEVDCYEDLEDAEVLFNEPPDLLLADVNLGTDSGLELVSRLRSIYPADVVPVIVISGLSSEEDFLRGFAAGANDYLPKPFSPAELLAKCATHLARRTGGLSKLGMLAGAPIPGGLEDAFCRYRVQGELGRGSSAIVYDAWDKHRDQQVALKVLIPSALSNPETKRRFLHEIVALAAVRSPHLARLVDHGEAEGRHYLSMEHVAGPNLKDWIQERGPLTDGELIELLTGLGLGLLALRESELVHRDIKPSNVILRNGESSEPVLVDFGLARVRHSRGVTTDGNLAGSPGYMAPEYVSGGEADYRSDLFAVGQVGLYARQGHGPFPDLNGIELLLKLMSCPAPIPEWLDPKVAALLRELTQVDPEQRIESAAALLKRLRRLRRHNASRV